MDVMTEEQRSRTMRSVKSRDTSIELRLRKALWARGWRYRKNYDGVVGTPDIAFPRIKVAIFCDSEFWHGYDWENRKQDIKSNKEYWLPKIEGNIERDKRVNRKLDEQGWSVLRFWEAEIKDDLKNCIRRIEQELQRRLSEKGRAEQ